MANQDLVVKMNNKYFLSCLLIVLTLVGCQNDLYKFGSKFNLPKKSREAPVVQFIVDGSLYDNTVETKNLSKALDYAKLPYKSISVDSFNEDPVIRPTSRVISVYETIGLENAAIDSILSFVAKGGTLHISKTILDPRLNFFMGLKPEADVSIDREASGFHFEKPLFPGKTGFKYVNNTSHLGYERKNFSDDITVLVSAANKTDYPVLYINKVGKGKVVVINTGATFKKDMRGFVFASILSGLEGIPYPVANVASLFLDDYPSATSDSNIPLEKVKEDWWPAMANLAKKQNLKYTAYVTFMGDRNVYPPFGVSERDNQRTTMIQEETGMSIGKQLLKDQHELGYHGYNHVPLLAPDWKRAENMVNAHRTAEKTWKVSGFDDLPMSYVPLENKIDSVGLQKLGEGISSLRFFQSSFTGDFAMGGNREFDPEPWNNRFFDFPRASSGYKVTPSTEWNIESLYLYTGIWSHNINAEHTKEWFYNSKILDGFNGYISDYKNRHPFARFIHASQSSGLTINWRYAEYNHTVSNGFYEVESYNNKNKTGPNFWLMYVDKDREKVMDENLENEPWQVEKVRLLQGYLYSIKTKEPYISVINIGNTKLISTVEDDVALNTIFQERKIYEDLQNSMFSFEDQLVRYDVEDELDMAINLIEDYIKLNTKVNSNLLLKYADYMQRQGKTAELWKNLDALYLKNPTAKKARVSQEIDKIAPFSSKEIQKIWMDRQLKWETADENSLLEYLSNFDTQENAKQVREVRAILYKNFPKKEYTTAYVTYLIESKDKDLIDELDKIAPCSIYDTALSTYISKTYAENLVFSKALEWQKCSEGIEETTIAEWKANTGEFLEKKEKDFPGYIALLLANDRETAAQELRLIKPCTFNLESMAYEITKLFAENAEYQRAINWSECANDISTVEKMSWLFELGKMKELKEYYAAYTSKTPKDNKVNQHMANLLLYDGQLLEAIKVIREVPLADIDPQFKQAINKEVRQADDEIQKEAFRLFINVMDPVTRKVVQRTKRQKEGSSIGADYFNTRDKFETISSTAGVFYEFYNDKGNTHRFTLVQSSMLAFEPLIASADNVGRDLIGLEYAYGIKPKEDISYNLRARLERDNENTLYAQLGARYTKINGNNKLRIGLDAMPVQNGPGYFLNIYNIAFTGAKELKLNSELTQSIFLESNYYTDNQVDAMLTGRLEYSLMSMNSFEFGPLVEASASLGTVNQRNGFPYWMAENRLLAGGGFSLNLGNDESKFKFDTNMAYFLEKDQDSFQRYMGTLSYNLSEYTKLNGVFQVYTIEDFYANTFNLGFIYKFK